MKPEESCINWTPGQHYAAACVLLDVADDMVDQEPSGPTEDMKFALPIMMARAQVHATLAGVEPRIRVLAQENQEDS